MSARISIIAAVACSGRDKKLKPKGTLTIGHNNIMPWHIPEDLKYFKRITMGHPVIMGRKTYDSIGKPLPGRFNIVITRNSELKIDGCVTVNSLKEAVKIAKAKDKDEIFIIGGGQIYKEAMRIASKIYLTAVDKVVKGDALFPKITPKWKEQSRSSLKIMENNRFPSPIGEEIGYCFIVYEWTGKSR